LKDPRTPKLLDVFGVKAILLDATAAQGSKLPLTAPLRGGAIAYAGPGGLVVSNPDALSPAFVAYRWRPSPSRKDSLLLMVARTARQARDEPVIETNAPSPPGPAPPATPTRIISRTDTEVTLDVRARAAGQLVLLDTFYPGWRAQVDGHATPIRPADAAFRAIPVSAGHHVVRFYYRPTSVIVGGGISIVALLAIVACLVLGGQRGLRFARGRRRASVSTPPSPAGSSPAYAVDSGRSSP
jgi:hypothetical protein